MLDDLKTAAELVQCGVSIHMHHVFTQQDVGMLSLMEGLQLWLFDTRTTHSLAGYRKHGGCEATRLTALLQSKSLCLLCTELKCQLRCGMHHYQSAFPCLHKTGSTPANAVNIIRDACVAYLPLVSAGAALLVGSACDGATNPLLLMALKRQSHIVLCRN